MKLFLGFARLAHMRVQDRSKSLQNAHLSEFNPHLATPKVDHLINLGAVKNPEDF
jgi:hypothetical protein